MLERPKAKPKTKTVAKPKPVAPTKSYVKNTFTVNRDGRSTEDVNKWRCKICKFLNEKLNEKCHMCSEPKTVLKEAAPKFGGANAQRRAKQVRVNRGGKATGSLRKPKKEEVKAPTAAPGANIHSIGDLNQQTTSQMGEGKKPRISKEPMVEQLKRIA